MAPISTADKLAAHWLPASIPPIRPGDLVEFSETGFHIAGRCIEGPDAGGWYLVESLESLRHTGCSDDTPAHIEPGDRRNVHWGMGLVGLVLELGADGRAARAVRPVPMQQPVERVVEIKPGQPKPASPDAERRRARAGNTIRKHTSAGTWAPINMGADGERFERQQLTTKLHPQARKRLDRLAAGAGLRACEVLEALLLDPGAADVVSNAKPMGVRPGHTKATKLQRTNRTGERRTRLTKAQAEHLDQLLLAMVQAGQTTKADLEKLAADATANGLPPQPVATLRTRMGRLPRISTQHPAP